MKTQFKSINQLIIFFVRMVASITSLPSTTSIDLSPQQPSARNQKCRRRRRESPLIPLVLFSLALLHFPRGSYSLVFPCHPTTTATKARHRHSSLFAVVRRPLPSSRPREDDASRTPLPGDDVDDDDDWYTTPSLSSASARKIAPPCAVDPECPSSRALTRAAGVSSDATHASLVRLSYLVVEWNTKINLVSRADCSPAVVFGRHVLPSLGLLALTETEGGERRLVDSGKRIVDVGTGGGFPGLPLAICVPEAEFTLVDSVGKKLAAVGAMAEELGLSNVSTHHGRAEEMEYLSPSKPGSPSHAQSYDLVLGRSVSALPRFCFWIRNLLKDDGSGGGRLLYIIGGDIERAILDQVEADIPLGELLGGRDDERDDDREAEGEIAGDKRALVFRREGVQEVAKMSTEMSRGQSAETEIKKKVAAEAKRKKRNNQKTTRNRRDNVVGQWEDRRRNGGITKAWSGQRIDVGGDDDWGRQK
uniref:Ribosomal RNA small subunit methyltransferase G n=1 Tax=Corethron hystrix TaxID=216773 RepID=A0A7S1BNQ7_9STRA|mmetsp:Transcript_33596/g.77498  ORF Transcript_33596/g.77498 Transcript_33596/m.77498 type:complete len:476 (+) Transcript_33596:26-1453(+)